MLAKAAIPGEVLWPLLLGSALTLIAQWAGLGYQTRRQREARRADFQRTTLLQLRDMLGEVQETVSRAMATRRRLSDEFLRELSGGDPDDWGAVLAASHPDVDALRILTYRLRLLATGVEHEPLRIAVGHISRWAELAPLSPSDKASEETREKLTTQQIKAVDLLGEQLRKLP